MRLTLLYAALFLAGCAGAPVDPQTDAAAREPLTCSGQAQCDHYWQRARAWLAQYSRYAIQSATDAELTTQGPFGKNVWLAYRVTRTDEAGGRMRIEMSAGCDNEIRCEPLPVQATAAFKRYVRD